MTLFGREKLTARLCRVSTWVSIEVHAPGDNTTVSINAPIGHRDIARFGERDLRQIVSLLEAQKSILIKQRNFPDAFGELLTSLKSAVEERYGGLPKK